MVFTPELVAVTLWRATTLSFGVLRRLALLEVEESFLGRPQGRLEVARETLPLKQLPEFAELQVAAEVAVDSLDQDGDVVLVHLVARDDRQVAGDLVNDKLAVVVAIEGVEESPQRGSLRKR